MATALEIVGTSAGFQWEGAADKGWSRHRVSRAECEEIFFGEPLVAASDFADADGEGRFYVRGQTARGRQLFIACTIRDRLIRVVSARPAAEGNGEAMRKRLRKAVNARGERRPLPEFASEEEERAFWEKADSTDFIDWGRATRVRLPELKPSTATISLRLPEPLLEELKVLANERDVPYQSLLKVFLAERLREERRRRSS